MRHHLILLAALAVSACAPEPPEHAAAEAPAPENVHVAVNPDGRIFWQGEEISEEELNRRTKAAQAQPQGPLKLAILADGSYTLDGEPMTLDQLETRLAALAKLDLLPEVQLEPDRRARYRDVVKAMEALQRNGMTKVGVIGGGASKHRTHHLSSLRRKRSL